MPLPKTENSFDAAAYLAWEETQPERNEYVAGEVFAMVGVRQSHNVATGNLYNILRRELKGSPCRVFIESVKTRIEAAEKCVRTGLREWSVEVQAQRSRCELVELPLASTDLAAALAWLPPRPRPAA